MSVAESTSQDNESSSPVLPWPLHSACKLWPEMSPAELMALSDDISANGQHDPVVLTPAGELLDGRNRALACLMAGVTPTFVTYAGDPVLFSLSRNKHRRHMSEAQIILVTAQLVTTKQGMNRFTLDHPNGRSIAKAAAEIDVTESKIKNALVVHKHGTAEEIEDVRTGKKKLRPTADKIRDRRRALAPPAPPKPNSTKPKPAADPIDDVACAIIDKCSDGKKRTVDKVASTVNVAPTAAKEALQRLKAEGCVSSHINGAVVEFRIESNEEARLRRALAAKDREIADLKARIAELEDEIERLAVRRDASSPTPSPEPAGAPSLDMVH
jgi:hypothetical protein